MFAFINLIGLSIAFTSSLLLFLTSYQEFTFNGMHKNKDSIFRYYIKTNQSDEVKYGSVAPAPVRAALLADFNDQISKITRIRDFGFILNYNEKKIEKKASAVDPDYLKMFSFHFVEGSTENALNELNSIVLREDVAKNIFDNESPIGKTLFMKIDGNTIPMVVSAIFKKLPPNTNIQSEILVRYEINPDYAKSFDRWNESNSEVYIQLKDKVDKSAFEKRLQPYCEKYYKDVIDQLKKDSGKPDQYGNLISVHLMPLMEEHFVKHLGGKHYTNKIYPYSLLIISLFIIIIACVNFVNLTIARSLNRSKEVGVRKALGALKWHIIRQFWGEAFLIFFISLGISLIIFNQCLVIFNDLFNTQIATSQIFDPTIFCIIVISFFSITFFAGGYPAWFISKINTTDILKGKNNIKAGPNFIRNFIIVKQFSISVLLISCTIIIWQQLNYMRNHPLGFNQENVISIPIGKEIQASKMISLLKTELSSHPNILSISAADNNIGYGKDKYFSKSQFGFLDSGKSISTNGLFVDFDYIKTLGLQLIAGRDFSHSFPTDSSQACIINESMAKSLGGNDLLGKKLDLNGGVTIIGIVKDYHFETLKNKIEPITLMVKGFPYTHIFIKIAANDIEATLSTIKKKYKEITPNSEYLGSFLDENTNEQYKAEWRFTQMFIYAALLAIILSCMHLFAIALITIKQRTKEIGLRKILGSSIANLIWCISKDFIKLVMVSILLATPFSYFFMKNWLQGFAYRIEIEWSVFLISGLLSLTIAVATISYYSISAALRNPVINLRAE